MAPERVQPHVAGLSRCLFCHDDVRPTTDAWVACEGCLARHHDSCWREYAGCAACAAPTALARPPRSRNLAPLSLALGLALGWTLALRAEALQRPEPEPVVAQVAPIETERTAAPRELPDHVLERYAFLVNEDRVVEAEALAAEMLARYPGAEPPDVQQYVAVEAARRAWVMRPQLPCLGPLRLGGR